MGSRFKIDLVSFVKNQLFRDRERKLREEAKLRADPVVAQRISAYHSRYPHLTPGVTLAAAKKGYDPDGPEIAKLGELAARRKISKGQGWYSIHDDPGLKDDPRKWFKELEAASPKRPDRSGSVLEAYKPLIRATALFGMSGGEVAGAAARTVARSVADRDLSKLLHPNEKISGIEALKSFAEGKGAQVGHGYIPHGKATEAQAEAARSNYAIEYEDKPLFSPPGTQTEGVRPHAGTVGRILFKEVLEPGSFWFNVASGATDFVVAATTDPAAKAAKLFSTHKAAKAQFTAEEAGRAAGAREGAIPTTATEAPTATTPFSDDIDPEFVGKSRAQITEILKQRQRAKVSSDIGLVNGRRNTVHARTYDNWLTSTDDGRKFVKWTAETKDAYTIWKAMGGEGSQLDPSFVRKMADTADENEALDLLSSSHGLGVNIRLKPNVGHFTPVGGTFEGVGIRDNIRSVRLLGTLPRGSIDVDDLPDATTQIVRYLRNVKTPEQDISPFFDAFTRATDTAERIDVMRNVVLHSAQKIVSDDLQTWGVQHNAKSLNHNFNRLAGIYRRDHEVVNEIVKLHASRGTSVDHILIDGELSPRIRSQYKDGEAINRVFYFPEPRELKKISSTYGRLLNHKALEMPLIALDAINSTMKGANILRPALAPRVHGEEHVRAAVAGYDTLFTAPRSYIAYVTGKKGNINLFGENVDALDEFSKYRKTLAQVSDLHYKIKAENRQVLPFTDKRFLSAWANDLYDLADDPVASRLAGRWKEGDPVTGNHVEDVKRWLSSSDPEALTYRAENPDITDDLLSDHVDTVNDTLTAKTYNNPTLLEAVRTNSFNGQPILILNKAGKPVFTDTFKRHLKTLVDQDKSPELTVGDMEVPKNRDDLNGMYRRATDHLFAWLLTNPSNKYNRSPVWKQQYWKSAGTELIIHATPEVQAEIIRKAAEANLGKKAVDALKDIAAKGSGDLTLTEVDFYANARAAEAVQNLFYNLADRSQVMDAMRLIWPFGEAWKEALTHWAKQIQDHPQVIPRALMAVQGARESGFFYTDPATGEEMFGYPGGAFVTKTLFGMPSPVQAPVQSLNMITGGGNPLMPGFGILAQIPASVIIPNTPKWDTVNNLINPYGEKDLENPFSFLPSWAQHLRNFIGTPANEVQFANTVMDVMRYLKSTNQYDLSTQRGLQQMEDRAVRLARGISLFRAIAQAILPATPSLLDVAKDKEGHTTTAFKLTDRYRQLLEEDRANDTNLAATKFIDEFGENNLLYMQSASKGGDVFTKSGYDWVRENQDIVNRYPRIYGLLAPKDGGFDIKAYHALFENGDRKPLTPEEALRAANHRVAKMAYRNAQDKLPDPNKRTKAQKAWLREVRADLISRYKGFIPEFQGNDIPDTIRDLAEAVEDPKVKKFPIAQAVSEYLAARQKVIDQALARKTPIEGWQTANATKAQRAWLRDVAADITSRVPAFKEINRELFDQELKEDD